MSTQKDGQRWVVVGGSIRENDIDGRLIARDMVFEDARRTAACVNAFAGVPIEWLENYVANDATNLLQDNTKLMEHNSELRAKLAAYENGVASECARASIKAADTLRKQRDSLYLILERLVVAKDEKDTNGDTPAYRALKDGAWERAREILASVEEA